MTTKNAFDPFGSKYAAHGGAIIFPLHKSIITLVLIFYLSEVERIPWGLFSLFKGHDLQVHGPRWLEIN